MVGPQSLEQRLTAVEQTVQQLQRRLDAMRGKASWLQRMYGAFDDLPEFDEIVRLGREFRHSDRPHDDDERAS